MTIDKSHHILIVDDYRQMRLAIQGILFELGFRNIHQANNGSEAQRVMQKQPIAAVISDWNMPGMTGFQLLEWTRQDEHYRKVPFMLLTAETDRNQIRAAMTAGVTEYMVKPFTVNTFTTKFWAMFDTRRSRPVPPPPPPAAPGSVAPAHAAARPASSQLPALSSRQVIGLDAPLDERLKRSTVLIVDDVATNIEVIAEVLKDDYTIKVAISGKKALDLVAAKAPDIILLDIMMPEMDGFEVCRRLKADPATADIPVIFLSAKDQPDDVVGGLEIGAVDYVVKPIAPTILKARMRTHLRLSTAMGDLKRQQSVLEDSALLREDVDRMTRHDLKNPIGAILQASQWLLEGGGPMTPQQREAAELIDNAARDALEMVNLSLDLYKMETGNYHPNPQPVRLVEVINQVVLETQSQFSYKHLHIQQNLPQGEVMGERLLCYSLFGNLVKNAAEAAPEHSSVQIDAYLREGYYVISIENQGGVPAEIRDTFFDKYVTHGKDGGTGLGTYSAKLITEVMGGVIELGGDDGHTRLTVSLPAA